MTSWITNLAPGSLTSQTKRENMVIIMVLKLFGLKLFTLISGLQELFWWRYMVMSVDIYISN